VIASNGLHNFPGFHSLSLRGLHVCQGAGFGHGRPGRVAEAIGSCLRAHGYHAFAAYQPASRYWLFQGIETGIFVLLAAALIAAAMIMVHRRDA
jgi:hypothetical protein